MGSINRRLGISLRLLSIFLCFSMPRGGGLVTKSCLTLATPWTVAHQVPLSPDKNTGVGCHSLLQWTLYISLTAGLPLRLLIIFVLYLFGCARP